MIQDQASTITESRISDRDLELLLMGQSTPRIIYACMFGKLLLLAVYSYTSVYHTASSISI
jgi:hypothetical protein